MKMNMLKDVNEKFDFAHILRGIAAISVVISHYVGVFWYANKETMAFVGMPALNDLPTFGFPISLIISLNLIFGMFGVGVFFVLSGFVIALAVQRETKRSFIIRRFFRIYPTYVIGFLVMMLGITLSTAAQNTEFPYSLSHIFVHTLILFRDVFKYARIDGISWTLEVEVVFYCMMVVWGQTILSRKTTGIWLAVGFVLIGSLPLILLKKNVFIGIQISCGLMLLIGIAFALHVRGEISQKEILGTVIGISVLLSLIWLVIVYRNNRSPQWLIGFLVGIAIFSLCYWRLRHTRFPSPILNWLSDISYPLYVVHGLTGYIIMYWVFLITKSATLAIVSATLVALIMAHVIHVVIERPSIRLSKSLTAPRI
jgi:peptidoglycan/LPS O-acetylase OafA/YrhL